MKLRNRKQMKQDSRDYYTGLAERMPEAKAAKAFMRQAYSTYTVSDCLHKWGIDTKEEVNAVWGIRR